MFKKKSHCKIHSCSTFAINCLKKINQYVCSKKYALGTGSLLPSFLYPQVLKLKGGENLEVIYAWKSPENNSYSPVDSKAVIKLEVTVLAERSLSRKLCIHHHHHQALTMQVSQISTYKFLEVQTLKNNMPISRYEQAQLDSIMETSPARVKYRQTNPQTRMGRLLLGAKHQHCVFELF